MVLYLVAVVYPLAWSSGLSETKKLSADAKAKITDSLEKKGSTDVLLFDAKGDLQESFKTDKIDFKSYGSLEDFVKSNKSPIDTCKNPIPTPPPPKCVICANGHTVCTKAKFSQTHSVQVDDK